MPFKPTPASIARRELAYATLKITADRVRLQPPISAQLRMLAKRLTRRNLPASPIFYLKSSGTDASRRLLTLYYSLPKDQRSLVPLEAFALAAGELSTRIFDIILQSVDMFSRQQSAVIAAASQPAVVEKSVAMALTDDGIDDRLLLGKATGFLPSPRGPSTVVNVAANANSAASATASPQIAIVAPPPEQTIRRLVDRFNDGNAKMLGEAPPSNIPARTVDREMEMEYVTVDATPADAPAPSASAPADEDLD